MSTSPGKSSGNIFYHLQFVFVIAAIIATLFTAWTDPGLLPNSLVEVFKPGLTKETTPQPEEIKPTSIPRLPVGIVAGHSGNDPGAVCPPELENTREVDVNLDVANRVRELLAQNGYVVNLLTEYDTRLQGFQAMALVSIHADSCEYVNEKATGFKVAAALSTIYPENTTRLTNCLRTRYAAKTNMDFHAGSVTPDMTSYHAFSEIDNNTPAAIIEIGFLNLDHEILTKQQDNIAQGVAKIGRAHV